jgi:hypothetical protein
MKINLIVIFVMTSLLFPFYSFLNNESIRNYEYELNNLVNEFKGGVSDDDEFEELVNQFDRLEDKIEDYNEETNTVESSLLYQKSEALTSLIGELSPDGRNFDLTIKKYELASPILGLTAYEHEHPNKEIYCLPIVHLFLWDNSYQTLLVVNKSSKLVLYNSEIVKAKEIVTGNFIESTSKGGVDCYSVRAIDGYFITEEGIIYCRNLGCESRPYCGTKK